MLITIDPFQILIITGRLLMAISLILAIYLLSTRPSPRLGCLGGILLILMAIIGAYSALLLLFP